MQIPEIGMYDKSVRLWSCKFGLESDSGQTKNLKLSIACLKFSIKGTVRKTSRQVYLLCQCEKHLAGLPHLGAVDRWLATPKRARYSALIAF